MLSHTHCCCSHLSQLSKVKCPHSGIGSSFYSFFFSSLILIILLFGIDWKDKMPILSQKCRLWLMGYSRWNWGLYPGCGWDSAAKSWLPGRLVKATLTQWAARPAFQVKCWLVDTSVNQLWNHHHNVLIDHTGLMTQLLAWRGCVLHSLSLQPSEKEHFE